MKRFKGYIADHKGRTEGKNGRPIRYEKGVLIEAEEGELDHVGAGMVPVYDDGVGGVSPAVPAVQAAPDVQTSNISSSDVETRPVRKSTRKRRTTSTAKK